MPSGTLLVSVAEPISRWHWGDSPTLDEKTATVGDEHTLIGGIVNEVKDPSKGFLDAIVSAIDAGALRLVEAAVIPDEDADGHSIGREAASTPELAASVEDAVAELAARNDAYLTALDDHRTEVWVKNADEFGVITDEGRDVVAASVEKAAPGLAKKAGL